MDIVMAINMGGDDYVTKPFDPNVLLAKIQGLLRRSYEFGTDQDLLEHRGRHPQSQIHGSGLRGRGG